jgi:hypothetical protein
MLKIIIHDMAIKENIKYFAENSYSRVLEKFRSSKLFSQALCSSQPS